MCLGGIENFCERREQLRDVKQENDAKIKKKKKNETGSKTSGKDVNGK